MPTSIISAIAHSSINLLTIQSLLAQNLLNRAYQLSKPTILTTVHHETHLKYEAQLNRLRLNANIRVVPYYYPLLSAHRCSSRTNSSPELNKFALLIGNSNKVLENELDQNRIVTLQQLCRAYPSKVPLSYRPRDSDPYKKILQNRLGISLSNDKTLQFDHILVINPKIEMWDEAFQVILDSQPAPLYIPYLKQNNNQNQLYNLSLNDFVSGLSKVHETVSSAVKTHPPLNVIQYNQRKQLDWIISEVARSACQMRIDRYFFESAPRIDNCNGAIQIVESLAPLL